MASGDKIFIADKQTLDQVKTTVTTINTNTAKDSTVAKATALSSLQTTASTINTTANTINTNINTALTRLNPTLLYQQMGSGNIPPQSADLSIVTNEPIGQNLVSVSGKGRILGFHSRVYRNSTDYPSFLRLNNVANSTFRFSYDQGGHLNMPFNNGFIIYTTASATLEGEYMVVYELY